MIQLAPKAGRPTVHLGCGDEALVEGEKAVGLPLRLTTGMVGSILTMACACPPLEATPETPIRKNGHLWREDCPAATARNDPQRAPEASESDGPAIMPDSRIGTKVRCLKYFGERIASRNSDSQSAEAHICIALMNRFNELGMADI